MIKRLFSLVFAVAFLAVAASALAQGDFVVNYRGLIAGRALSTNGFVTLYRSEHSYYLAIESSPTASASWTMRLPVSAGSSGQCLKTDGAGVTSWAACYTLSGALLTANNLSELTATASTARTNLGLGTLATQSGTFSGISSGTNTGDQTTITGNAGTATALAADPPDCSVGSAARGIDATGAAANCFAVPAGTGTVSGANTGDQTITLTGGVTGSGTGSFAATVATNANLTGPVTSVGNATTIADAELSAVAGLTSAADKVPYFTGSGTASVADLTAAARTVLDDTTVAAMVDTLGGAAAVGTGGLLRSSAEFTATVASGPTYCADAGSSDAYACNLTAAPASYAAVIGVPLTFYANTVNTGAATISFNSLGAQAIVKVGATTTTALVTNDIRAGSLVTVQWDGSNFECLSCNGNYANLAIANTWSLVQTFGAGLIVSGGSFTTNTYKQYFDAADGAVVNGQAGTLSDWTVNESGGGVILSNPAGTNDVVLGNANTTGVRSFGGGTRTGSDSVGAGVTLRSGLGTGLGVSTPLTLNRVNTKATGSTTQTYSPAIILCPTKILSNTSGTAQTIATVTTTTTTGGSVTMDYTTVANNGTLQDVDGGIVKVSWRNNAGTVAGAMSAIALQSDSDASGTLATTPTSTVATNVVSIKFTPTWVTIVPTTVTGWATFTVFSSGDTVTCQ